MTKLVMIKGYKMEVVEVTNKRVVVKVISKELADVLYNMGYVVVIR